MIKHPERFNQAKPAGFDGLFDWDFLTPAFQGTKIEPMDIDAVIERRGKVLIFETKEPGKSIPLGQEITFNTLLKIGKGNIHLMVIYGKTIDTIAAMDEWVCMDGHVRRTGIRECNADYVFNRVLSWFNWANSEFSN